MAFGNSLNSTIPAKPMKTTAMAYSPIVCPSSWEKKKRHIAERLDFRRSDSDFVAWQGGYPFQKLERRIACLDGCETKPSSMRIITNALFRFGIKYEIKLKTENYVLI